MAPILTCESNNRRGLGGTAFFGRLNICYKPSVSITSGKLEYGFHIFNYRLDAQRRALSKILSPIHTMKLRRLVYFSGGGDILQEQARLEEAYNFIRGEIFPRWDKRGGWTIILKKDLPCQGLCNRKLRRIEIQRIIPIKGSLSAVLQT